MIPANAPNPATTLIVFSLPLSEGVYTLRADIDGMELSRTINVPSCTQDPIPPASACIRVGSGNSPITGTNGPDTLIGTSAPNSMNGLGGNDAMNGCDGSDSVNGNTGNDGLAGGTGDDRVRGNEGDDIVQGDAGNDVVVGDSGADTLTGGPGSDTFLCGLQVNFVSNDITFQVYPDPKITNESNNGTDVMPGEDKSDTYNFSQE
ncbi:MAG: calcium-binding protein [Nitrososphaeraceae archaeon]